MKKTLLILSLFYYGAVSAQTSSNDYTNFMYTKLAAVNDDFNNDTTLRSYTLRRVETGVMKNESSHPSIEVRRFLYENLDYLFVAFTDKRVKDIELSFYNDAKQSLVQKNDNVSDGTDGLMGDYELLSYTPNDSGEYYIDIKSVNATSEVARYGLMIWSKPHNAADNDNNNSGTTTTTNTTTTDNDGTQNQYFSMDKYDLCYQNSTTNSYSDCTTTDGAPGSSLFTLNSNGSIFRHQAASMTSNYYVQSKAYSSDVNGDVYSVLSDAGNAYKFYVPYDHTYILVLNENANPKYYIKHNVRRYWTGTN